MGGTLHILIYTYSSSLLQKVPTKLRRKFESFETLTVRICSVPACVNLPLHEWGGIIMSGCLNIPYKMFSVTFTQMM